MVDESGVFTVGSKEPLTRGEAKARSKLRQEFQKKEGITRDDTRYLEYEQTDSGYRASLSDEREDVVRSRLRSEQAEEDRRLYNKLNDGGMGSIGETTTTSSNQDSRTSTLSNFERRGGPRSQLNTQETAERSRLNLSDARRDPVQFLKDAGPQREREFLNLLTGNAKQKVTKRVNRPDWMPNSEQEFISGLVGGYVPSWVPSSEAEFSNQVKSSVADNKEGIATAAAAGLVAPEPATTVGGAATLGALALVGIGAELAIDEYQPEISIPGQQQQSELEPQGGISESELNAPIDGQQQSELDIQNTQPTGELDVPTQDSDDIGTLSTSAVLQEFAEEEEQQKERVSNDPLSEALREMERSQRQGFANKPPESYVEIDRSEYENVDWDPFEIVGYQGGAEAVSAVESEFGDATAQQFDQATIQSPGVSSTPIGAIGTRQEQATQPATGVRSVPDIGQAQQQSVGQFEVGQLVQGQQPAFETLFGAETGQINETTNPNINATEDVYEYPNPYETSSGRSRDLRSPLELPDSSSSRKRRRRGSLVGEYEFDFINPLTGQADSRNETSVTQSLSSLFE